ncbi:winged helix-turn-helix domain-containing protein [Granulicella cerasi]|uniref:Winged helix-turn-helix domain-containing protein n=1 Tax=Granulicella cerasi TaxID=741063 RepID=A0ABW1ZBJ9_9BACT|nr:winged helix-turn-helix domain-containing protein [Granulicella cerasi]
MEVSPDKQFEAVYTFGGFEVSSLTNALYKEGEVVRIQYLPLQLLLALLERAGQMVSKEELRDRLWGNDTFVEVDQNLYVIVSKLRELLEDTARQPRFIQTVPGRGYRFIGTIVTRKLPAPSVEEAPTVATATPQPEPGSTEAAEGAVVSENSPPRSRWHAPALSFGGALCVLAVVLAFLHYRSEHTPIYKPHDRILISSFRNETTKSELTQTLGFAVQLKFQESPTFELVQPQRGQPFVGESSESSHENQLQACSQLGGQLLIDGELKPRGQGYEIALMTSRCSDGKLLATESADADSDASILSAIDVVTDKMRQRLGEPGGVRQRFNMPLTQATTNSLAALEAFTQGEEKLKQGHALEAVASYKLAADLDPQFALAYARLGTIYLNAQEQSIGVGYYQKAFQLRDHTTDRERLYIAAHYYTDVTGEYTQAIDTYQLWRNLYPNDFGAANNLANLYDMLGHPEEALRYAQQAVAINPASPLATATLAQAYLTSGQYAPLTAICHQDSTRTSPMVVLHNICFLGAVGRNDETDMQRELRWAQGNPQESVLLQSAALAALAHGRVMVARDLFAHARKSADQNHLPELMAIVDIDQSNAEAELGFSQTALAMVHQADHASPQGYDKTHDTDALAGEALTLAIAGSSQAAIERANQAVQLAPLNSILNNLEVPTIQAVVAVKQQKPREALDLLQRTTPLQFYSQTKFIPIYYRGLAYMQLKQWKDAEEQFNTILQHRAIVPHSLYIGLAQMRLGEALQQDGQTKEAKEAFDAAAQLWRDAPSDFPPARQLKSYR